MIRLDITEDRAEIVLDRPARLNALSAEMLIALDEALDEIAASPARVVMIQGAGDRAFCAGADVEELTGSRNQTRNWLVRGHDVFRRIEHSPRPVVAVVAGLALGGGLELALSCHLVVATTSARVGLPEPKLGLIPGLGGIQRLTALIGRQRAARLLLTGEMLSAAEADSLGMLSFPPVEPTFLPKFVEGLCSTIAALSPTALAAILRSQVGEAALGDALIEDVNAAVTAIHSADGREGIAAFAEKRQPLFLGPSQAND